MRGFVLALALLVAPSLAAQGPAAVRDYQPGVDAQHYVIHVIIPDSGRTVGVISTLYLGRTRAVDSLWLDLESVMVVKQVTVNGRDVKFGRDAHTIRLALPKWNPTCADPNRSREIGPNVCVDIVSVDASGVPTDGLIISQDPQHRWQYFTDHWPNRARQWLPVIDHPSDKATVEWRVHAPSALRVVSNGRLTEESTIPNEPGRSITAWQTEKPIPPYLMAIAVAPLARLATGTDACGRSEAGGCVVQEVYEAPELAPAAPPGFTYSGRIVEWLSRFVAPFPYEKLSHLESTTRFGGMENASAIFYADQQFRRMTLADGLVAHETAHQWFGDAVTEARWADLWLSEGFATYFAALWQREARGDSAFRSAMAGIKRTVLNAAEVKERPVIDLAQTDLMKLLNANSYQKGGFVLHMLRGVVGDSAWIRGIRRYYAAHKHKNAVTDDLRSAIEAETKTDLKWFFDQWLTRPGYAEVSAQWSFTNGRLAFSFSQNGPFGAYRLRMPVEVEDASGAVSRFIVDVGLTDASVPSPNAFSAKPRRVTFDPDGDLLAVIKTQ